jgi:hypothetical protein
VGKGASRRAHHSYFNKVGGHASALPTLQISSSDVT